MSLGTRPWEHPPPPSTCKEEPMLGTSQYLMAKCMEFPNCPLTRILFWQTSRRPGGTLRSGARPFKELQAQARFVQCCYIYNVNWPYSGESDPIFFFFFTQRVLRIVIWPFVFSEQKLTSFYCYLARLTCAKLITPNRCIFDPLQRFCKTLWTFQLTGKSYYCGHCTIVAFFLTMVLRELETWK